MTLNIWRRWVSGLFSRAVRRARPRLRLLKKPRRLGVEQLEDRVVPATDTWTGGAGTPFWATTGNWSLNRVPMTGDTVVFPSVISANGITVDDNLTTNPVLSEVNIAGAAYTLNGPAPLIVSGSVVVNADITQVTVNQTLELMPTSPTTPQATISVGQGSIMAMTAAIQAAANVTVTKTGVGYLDLGVASPNWFGSLTIAGNGGSAGGYVVDEAAGALGSTVITVGTLSQLQLDPTTGSFSGANAIANTLLTNGSGLAGDGALLNVAGNNTWTGPITMDSDTTFGADANTTLTITGQIADNGNGHNLFKVGQGTLVLPNANTYRGDTTVADGILVIENPLSLGAGANALDSQSGSQNSETIVTDNPTDNQYGTLELNFSQNTIASTDPNAIYNQAGQLVGFQVFNDYLVLNGPGFSKALNDTNNLGALYNASGDNEWDGTIDLGGDTPATANPVIDSAAGTTLVASGLVADPNQASSVYKTGGGTLVFSDTNTYRGVVFGGLTVGTYVEGGILDMTDSQALGSGAVVVSSGATVQMDVDSGFDGTSQRSHGRNLAFDSVTGTGPGQEIDVIGTTGTFTLSLGGKTTPTALSVSDPNLAGATGDIANAVNSLLAAAGLPETVSSVTQDGDVYRVLFSSSGPASQVPLMTVNVASGTPDIVVDPIYGLTVANEVVIDGSGVSTANGLTMGALDSHTGLNVNTGLVYDGILLAVGLRPATAAIGVDADLSPAVAITAIAETGTTVTVTTATPIATLLAGQQVAVNGLTPAGYNGTFTVTSVSGNQFTYTAATGLGAATLGNATAAPSQPSLGLDQQYDNRIGHPLADNDYFQWDYGMTVADGGVIEGGDLVKTGFGDLILPNENTYGDTTGVNAPTTDIELGWITIANAESLGPNASPANAAAEGLGTPQTKQYYVDIQNGGALHIDPVPGSALTMYYNFEIAGLGLTTQNYGLIEQAGAIENLNGDNTLAGIIQLDETQTVTVPAGATGNFTLTFNGQSTGALQDNDPNLAADMQTDLNQLTSITGVGGTASVVNETGGVYSVTFGGSLAGSAVPLLVASNGVTTAFANAGIGVEQIPASIPNPPNSGFLPLPATSPPLTASQLTLTGYLWNFGQSTSGLTKLGSRRLIVQGTGTYTGNVDVHEGVMLVQSDTALGYGQATSNLPNVTVETGSALEIGNTVNDENVGNGLVNEDGGVQGGLAVSGEQLDLSGPGDPSYDDSALSVLAGNAPTTGPTVQTLTVTGNQSAAGAFTLSFNGASITLPGNVSASLLQTALDSLSTIGGAGGSVTVAQNGNVYQVTFGGSLLNTATPLVFSPSNPYTGTFAVVTVIQVGTTTSVLAPVNDPLVATDDVWRGPVVLGSSTTITTDTNSALPATEAASRLIVTGSVSDTYSATAANQPITAAAESGNTVTITTAAPAGYVAGQTVTISGLAPAQFNGTFIVTSSSGTQFTYTATAGLGTATVSAGAEAVGAPPSLTLTGGGEVDLDGTNTFSGSTFVQQGIASLGGSNALGGAGIAEVQTVTLSGANPGSQFLLTWNGYAIPGVAAIAATPTALITYEGDATAAELTATANAIAAALTGVVDTSGAQADAAASVSVTPSAPGSAVFTVTFGGSVKGFTVNPLGGGNFVTGSGTVSTAVTTLGAGGTVVENGAQLQVAGAFTQAQEPIVLEGNGTVQDVPTVTVSSSATTFTLSFTGPDNTGVTATDVTGVLSAADPTLAADMQTALDKLPNIGGIGGSVTVSLTAPGSGVYAVVFGGSLATHDVQTLAVSTQAVADSVSVQSAQAGVITVSPNASGTFILTYSGPDATGNVVARTTPASGAGALNASSTTLASDIQKALDALSNIGGIGGSVIVTETGTGVYTVFFGGTLTGEGAQPLTVSTQPVTGTVSVQTTQGGAPTEWFPVGPVQTNNGNTDKTSQPVSGEVTAEAVDPNDPTVMYIGTAGGGVWKSIDGGNSWQAIFDAIPQVETITIAAGTTGTFTLSFNGATSSGGAAVTETTTALSVSAATLNSNTLAQDIQAALDALPNIGGVGGQVTVSQSNANGTITYMVTFNGTLAGAGVNPQGLPYYSPLSVNNVSTPLGNITSAEVQAGVDPAYAMYIGAVTIDPVDTDIVYVGTGVLENTSDYSVFDNITAPNNYQYTDSYYGTGVYRTADGGLTWSPLLDNTSGIETTTTSGVFPDTGGQVSNPVTGTYLVNPIFGMGVSAIALDPQTEIMDGQINPDPTIYVADGTVDVYPLEQNPGGSAEQDGLGVPNGGIGNDAKIQLDAAGNPIGVISPGGTGQVAGVWRFTANPTQALTFYGLTQGETFNLTFEGESTQGITINGQPLTYEGTTGTFTDPNTGVLFTGPAATADEIAVFLDQLPAVGGSGGYIYVNAPNGTTDSAFVISFLGALSDTDGTADPVLPLLSGQPSSAGNIKVGAVTGVTLGTWFVLTDYTSTNRETLDGNQPYPPNAPGPEDNFRINFPENELSQYENGMMEPVWWTDVTVEDEVTTNDGAGFQFPQPPNDPLVPVVYASLGSPDTPDSFDFYPDYTILGGNDMVDSYLPKYLDRAVGGVNAVYRCYAPDSDSPLWYIGDPGSPQDQIESITFTDPDGDVPSAFLSLGFNGADTPVIIYLSDANMSNTIQTDLDNLSTIGGLGSPGFVIVQQISQVGDVSVYYVTFEGGLADTPLPLIQVVNPGAALTPAQNGSVVVAVVTPGGGEDTESGDEFPTWLMDRTPATDIGTIKITQPFNPITYQIPPGPVPYIYPPVDDTTMYASVATGSTGDTLGIWKSTDGGGAWTELANTPEYMNGQGNYANAILSDPDNPNVLWVGGASANIDDPTGMIWESTDGGVTWTDVTEDSNNDSPHNAVHALVAANDKILVQTRTSDGISETDNADGIVNLIAGTDGGIWELDTSTTPKLDNTYSWNDLNSNLNIAEVTGVGVAVDDPNDMVVGTTGNGLDYTSGNGLSYYSSLFTWTETDQTGGMAGAGPDGGEVIVDPNNPSIVYAILSNPPTNALAANFLESTDGGKDWTPITSLPSGIDLTSNYPFFTFTVDQLDPNIILVGTPYYQILNAQGQVIPQGGLFESEDGGKTWTPLTIDSVEQAPLEFLRNLNINAIAVAGYQGSFVADSSFSDVTDIGTTQPDLSTIYLGVASGEIPFPNYVPPWNLGTNVPGVAQQEFLVTKDDGLNWVNRTPMGLKGAIESITVNPANRDNVFILTQGADGSNENQVWESTDAGQTWTTQEAPIGGAGATVSGLPDVPLWQMSVDPRTGSLYIGTDIGVYTLQAAAPLTPAGPAAVPTNNNEWVRFGTGLPNVSVRTLNLDLTTDTITVGTFGQGVYQVFLDADQSTPNPVGAAAVGLSGSSVWGGSVLLVGDPQTNSVSIAADGTQGLPDGVTAASLNIIGSVSDLVPGSDTTLVKQGDGDVTLSAANTYGGTTVVEEANLIADNNDALGASAAPVEVTAASESNTTTVTITTASQLADLVAGADVTINGVGAGYDGTYMVTQVGTDEFQYIAAASGLSSVSPAAAQAVAGGTVVDTGASLGLLDSVGNPSTSPEEVVTLNGNGISFGGHFLGALRNIDGDNTFYGDVILAAPPANAIPTVTVEADSGSELTVDGVISGGGAGMSLVKEGTGIIAFDAPNTYAGNTAVYQGALQAQVAGAFSAGSVEVLDGAEASLLTPAGENPFAITNPLTLSGTGIDNDGALYDAGGDNTWSGAITLSILPGFAPYTLDEGNVSVGAAAGTIMTLAGEIEEESAPSTTGAVLPGGILPMGLTKVDAGTVVLSNSNVFTGMTEVAQGYLDLQNTGAPGARVSPSGVNLTVGATDTDVTPDGYTPVASDKGKLLQITSGNQWSAGTYQIVNVLNPGQPNAQWVLSAAPAPTGATGGEWRLDPETVEQIVTLSNATPTGVGTGYFTLSFDGQSNTADHLPFGASAAAVQAAVSGLFSSGGAVTVSATPVQTTYETGLGATSPHGAVTGWVYTLVFSQGLADTTDQVQAIGWLGTIASTNIVGDGGAGVLVDNNTNGAGEVELDNSLLAAPVTNLNVSNYTIDLNGSGPSGTITVAPGSTGTFALSFTGPDDSGTVVTTTTGPLNAASPNLAGQIQTALDDLSNIGGLGEGVQVAATGTAGVFSVLFDGPAPNLSVASQPANGSVSVQQPQGALYSLVGNNTWSGPVVLDSNSAVSAAPDNTLSLTNVDSVATQFGATPNLAPVLDVVGTQPGGSTPGTVVFPTGATFTEQITFGTGDLQEALGVSVVSPGGYLEVDAFGTNPLGTTGFSPVELNGGVVSGNGAVTGEPSSVLTGNGVVTGPANGISDYPSNVGGTIDPGDNAAGETAGVLTSATNLTLTPVDTYFAFVSLPYIGPDSSEITIASETGTTVTITTAAELTGLGAGEPITITGIAPAGYDGTFIVTSVSNNTMTGVYQFTYTAAAGLGAATLDDATATQTNQNINDVLNVDGTLTLDNPMIAGLVNSQIPFNEPYTVITASQITGQFNTIAADEIPNGSTIEAGASFGTIDYMDGVRFEVDYFDGTGAAGSARVDVIRELTPLATPVLNYTSSLFYGQDNILTATLASTDPSAPIPSGNIIFWVTDPSGNTTKYTVAMANGTATLDLAVASKAPLQVGTYTFYISYDGYSNGILTYEPITQYPVPGDMFTVNPAFTTVTALLQNYPSPEVYGEPWSISATVASTVSPTTSGTVAPAGSVNFYSGNPASGGALLGSATLTAVSGDSTPTSTAVFSSTSLSQFLGVGDYSIYVVYEPSTNPQDYQPPANPTVIGLPVNQDGTTVTVSLGSQSATPPFVYGEAGVVFQATVTANSPGAGNPTGTVEFLDGTLVLGTGTLSPSGVGSTATYTTVSGQLLEGNTTISVIYDGDSNFKSSGGTMPLTVNPASTAITSLTTSANPTTFGTPVTFTATVVAVSPGGGNPTGTVNFLLNGTTPIGSGTLGSTGGVTTASYTTTAFQLPAGTDTITAQYVSNSTNFNGTTSSPSVSEVVAPASPGVSVVSSTSTSVYGQPVTFTATVTPPAGGPTPTGTVSFFLGGAGGTPLGTGTLGTTAGVTTASYTTTTGQLPVGAAQTITAVFNSTNPDYTTGLGTTNVTVNQDGTSTAITSPGPVLSGQTSITFTVVVAPNGPGGGDPTGQVTLTSTAGSNTTTIGTGTLSTHNGVTSAQVQVATSLLTPGADLITATYAGDTNFTGSSASLTEGVQDTTTTTLSASSSPSPAVFGQAVTLTATITPTGSADSNPTGTVTFTYGGSTLGVAGIGTVIVGGLPVTTAVLTVSDLPVGTDQVNAYYSGDTTFIGSAGSLGVPIGKDATATTLAATAMSLEKGQAVVFTAQVDTQAPGNGTPTGTVTFMENGSTVIGTASLDPTGTASLQTALTTVGTFTVTAEYNGDGNDQTSTSTPPIQVTVSPTGTRASTVALASSTNPSVFGNPVTFTATVKDAGSGGGHTPTGTVSFFSGGALLGYGTLTASAKGAAVATFTTSVLAQGTDTISAAYNGDATFAHKASANLSQIVEPGDTTLSLQSSNLTAGYGMPVIFTATVTDAGGATASGKVTFTATNTTTGAVIKLGTGTLAGSNGLATASVQTSTLPIGTYTVTASYGGETSSDTEIISAAQSVVILTSSLPNGSVYGQAVTFSATVSVPGSSVKPTGTVTFTLPSGATTTVTLKKGIATFKTTLLPAGTPSVTAVYNGLVVSGVQEIAPSQPVSINQDVSEDPTNMTLASTTTSDAPITMTATVTATKPGGGTPTGSVAFYFNGVYLGTATVGSNGVAKLTETSVTFPPGTYPIEAIYTDPNDNYETMTVNKMVTLVTGRGT